MGSVSESITSAGTVISYSIYDAYGNKLNSGSQSPFGFGAQSGYITDTESGWMLLTHRYYDPAEGRFLTRDPIGYSGGVNLYAYCGNNPVNWADPSGLKSVWKIPASYGNLPRVMVCYRPVENPSFLKPYARHAFLVVDRVPFGYGPGGVDQIVSDMNYLKNGLNNGNSNSATCDFVSASSKQIECLIDIRDKYLDDDQTNDPILPNGPWCPKTCDGYGCGYKWNNHNCGHFTNDVLNKCRIYSYQTPDLVGDAKYRYSEKINMSDCVCY